MTTASFALETLRTSAAEFHAADLLGARTARVVVAAATDAAVVLGSRQRADVLDVAACRAAGLAIVMRRSGGGVVLVEPDEMAWFDVVLPADDPHFAPIVADVGLSMRWLGARVATALAELGVDGADVHDAGMTGGPLGALLCFAGVGPGEVLLGGRKLVGISQRRTRLGSRFQCMVHARWSPERLVALLAEPRPTVAELPPVAVLPAGVAAALPGAVAGVLSAG
jgi:lipoate-protein ligase A